MIVKLIVVGGEANNSEIQLKLPSIIGRGRDATITLSHPLVSRRHCEIFQRDGKLMVRDLGSLNGTFIGSQPIAEAVLQPGELLTVGTVTFRAIFGVDQASASVISEDQERRFGSFDETEFFDSEASKTAIHFDTTKEALHDNLENDFTSEAEMDLAKNRSEHKLDFAD